MRAEAAWGLAIFLVVLITGYTWLGKTKEANEQYVSAGKIITPSAPQQANNKPVSMEFGMGVDALLDPIFDEESTPASLENAMNPIAETRMVAKATSHMSDAQMFEFQTLRKGTIVRRADGFLNEPYKKQKQCDEEDICLQIIVDGQTGNVIWDGQWSGNIVETGVGQEVVWRPTAP